MRGVELPAKMERRSLAALAIIGVVGPRPERHIGHSRSRAPSFSSHEVFGTEDVL